MALNLATKKMPRPPLPLRCSAMATCPSSDRNSVYISCLTYLAAEAERDNNHVIASILKSATANIYEWMQDGCDTSPKEMNSFMDSITAAFIFLLQHKSLSRDKKDRMVGLIQALEHAKMH